MKVRGPCKGCKNPHDSFIICHLIILNGCNVLHITTIIDQRFMKTKFI